MYYVTVVEVSHHVSVVVCFMHIVIIMLTVMVATSRISLVFARLCQCEPHPIHDCLGPCESAPKRHRDQFCCVYTAHTVVTNIQTRNIGKCVATGFVLAIWHNTVNEYGGSDEIGCCEMNQLLQH